MQMGHGIFRAVILLMAIAIPMAARAQQAMTAPPVLWVEREMVAKGKAPAHTEVVHKILEQYESHHFGFHVLGISAIVPDQDEAMFLIGFDSFAAIEDYEKSFAAQPAEVQKSLLDLESQEDAMHASKQNMVAVFRPDLSYRADASVMAKARLLLVDQFTVTLGHMPDYESDVKFLKAASERAGVDEHYFVYQTIGGAESQTVIVLRPLQSLAELDKASETGEKLRNSLDKAGRERLRRLWKDSVLQGTGQSVDRLYVIRPDLSLVSDGFAALDPNYWRPKKP